MALSLNGSTGISGIDGHSGVPAIKGADADTGIFFGTDTASISTAGTNRFHITSTGLIGVGTSSPAGGFHVDAASGVDGPIFDSGGTANANHALLVRDSSNNQLLRVNNNGNVGIANTSPTHRLSIAGTANNTNSELQITATSVASAYFGANADGLNLGTDTGGIVFKTNVTGGGSVGGTGFERMRVDSANNGRILIGTSSVIGGTTKDSYYARVTIRGRGDTGGAEGRVAIVRDEASTTVTADEPIGNVFFADANGNSYAAIYVNADQNATGGSSPGRMSFFTTAASHTNPVEQMRITRQGRILCGTTAEYGRIHATGQGFNPESISWLGAAFVGSSSFGGGIALLDGTQGYSIYCKDAGNDFFIRGHTGLTNSATGGVQLNNRATSWTSASDERDKENLIPITNAVDKIKSLRTVTGNYYWAPETSCAFLIAQDVQQVLPEAVSVLDKEAEVDNQRLGIAYAQTIPLLTAALKEAIAKIETLEAKVAALEAS